MALRQVGRGTMRFDSTPYYHLGSVYPWDKMVDEMRDEARLLEQGGFTGSGSPSTISHGMAGSGLRRTR